MKKKILAVICILLAIFNAVLFVRALTTRGDGNLTDIVYLNVPDEISDEYEGKTIILADQIKMVDGAVDEETGFEFWEPLIAKSKEVERYDSTNGYTWSVEKTDYFSGGLKMAHADVETELLIPLIGTDDTFPTNDSMEKAGYSIYDYDGESKRFVALDEEEEKEGTGLTGRIRYSFRYFEPEAEDTYTLIAKVENGALVKPDLVLAQYVYEGVKTPEELTASEGKNSTVTLICTAVLTLGFLFGGVLLFIKSKNG